MEIKDKLECSIEHITANKKAICSGPDGELIIVNKVNLSDRSINVEITNIGEEVYFAKKTFRTKTISDADEKPTEKDDSEPYEMDEDGEEEYFNSDEEDGDDDSDEEEF